MDDRGEIPGAAGLGLVDGVSLFRPEEQVFEATLEGFANQQLARNLAYSTVKAREHQVRAFAGRAEAFPWRWSANLVDEWFSDQRAVRHVARSTVRSYQVAIRGFCSYLTDPAYGWAAEYERRFGTHPIQVIHEVNAAAHVADSEAEPARRAFTRAELQALFDHADDEVARQRALGHKRWLPTFRDATILKIAYGATHPALRPNRPRGSSVSPSPTSPTTATSS
ncbi:hypothetical protein ACIA58_23480 [Kribbella sp. NPDC051586]|uniref:hypothetical protein n=1 Tax=Kribbella sp. NPDC051586 TaxID=3364118 RepID=UPI0037A6FCDD